MRETIVINGHTFPVVSSSGRQPAPSKPRVRKPRIPFCGEPAEGGTLLLSMAPPSTNALFFNSKKGGRGRTLSYRNWRAFAHQELRDQPAWHVPGKVAIVVRVGGAKTDADNMLKAALDALVTAGRIEGDSPRHVAKVTAEHDDGIGTRIEIRRAV